eukprot:g8474.t1
MLIWTITTTPALCGIDYGMAGVYNWRIALISGGHTCAALSLEGFRDLNIQIVLLDPKIDEYPDLIDALALTKNDIKEGLPAQFLEAVPIMAKVQISNFSADKDYAAYQQKQQAAGATVQDFDGWLQPRLPKYKGKVQGYKAHAVTMSKKGYFTWYTHCGLAIYSSAPPDAQERMWSFWVGTLSKLMKGDGTGYDVRNKWFDMRGSVRIRAEFACGKQADVIKLDEEDDEYIKHLLAQNVPFERFRQQHEDEYKDAMNCDDLRRRLPAREVVVVDNIMRVLTAIKELRQFYHSFGGATLTDEQEEDKREITTRCNPMHYRLRCKMQHKVGRREKKTAQEDKDEKSLIKRLNTLIAAQYDLCPRQIPFLTLKVVMWDQDPAKPTRIATKMFCTTLCMTAADEKKTAEELKKEKFFCTDISCSPPKNWLEIVKTGVEKKKFYLPLYAGPGGVFEIDESMDVKVRDRQPAQAAAPADGAEAAGEQDANAGANQGGAGAAAKAKAKAKGKAKVRVRTCNDRARPITITLTPKQITLTQNVIFTSGSASAGTGAHGRRRTRVRVHTCVRMHTHAHVRMYAHARAPAPARTHAKGKAKAAPAPKAAAKAAAPPPAPAPAPAPERLLPPENEAAAPAGAEGAAAGGGQAAAAAAPAPEEDEPEEDSLQLDMYAPEGETAEAREIRVAAQNRYATDPFGCSKEWVTKVDESSNRRMLYWAKCMMAEDLIKHTVADGEVGIHGAEKLRFRLTPDEDAHKYEVNTDNLVASHLFYFPKLFTITGDWSWPEKESHSFGMGRLQYYWTMPENRVTTTAPHQMIAWEQMKCEIPKEDNSGKMHQITAWAPMFAPEDGIASKKMRIISKG